ncbi:hypothetical protein A4G26_08305 [Mycobacterium kansasii]|uniref:Bifunctional ligase/repressor BirA n=1 Tax=Mycobacterium innocens TaxID=2341083 RepID=A0A498PVH0_9MYCO|nr:MULTISPECIES: HTH domain-containing protein [Mycobacterium]KZS67879.1 hypothetical protein A4G26_08305 [Mycobacterium kansasii]VBA35491.1 Bifunctional ligase/repressor BirA [Mycobacterium innocens]
MSATASRVLQLLGLLQSRRVWTGQELAQQLSVTGRSVPRDVERLRELGYPVEASKGPAGGYRLGTGATLPPLLLDPDEAVAVAVCLRHAISAAPYRYVARVRYQVPASVVARHFSPQSMTVEPDGDEACVVTAGGDDPHRMVLYFATVGAEFEVLEPAEVQAAAGAVGKRLRRAGKAP